MAIPQVRNEVLVVSHARGASPSSQECCWLGRSIVTLCNQTLAGCTQIANWAISFFISSDSPKAEVPLHSHLISRKSTQASAAPIQFDPTMVKLQSFMTNVATLMGNSLYSHFIQPAIQGLITDMQKLPSDLSQYEVITESIAKAIATELVQIIDSASADAMGFAKMTLTWLVYGSNAQNTKDQLKQSLSQKYAADLASQPDLVDRFLNWLCDSSSASKATSIPTLASIEASAEDLLLSLLISSLQTLIDNKIRAFIQALTQFIQGDVAPLLQQIVSTNSTIIGEVISNRFATLIQGTSPVNAKENSPTIYQQNYDQILQMVLQHVEAVIKAYKSEATTPIATAFSQDPACDPNVRLIINPPAGQDPSTYQNSIEQAVSLQTAKALVALLLPDQSTSVNGLIITTPGIISLLGQLQLPPQIEQAFASILQLPSALFSGGIPPNVAQIGQAINYFIQRSFASIVNDQIENGLAIGLKLGLNYVVPPQFLNMWMTQGAFPSLLQALCQSILCALLVDPNDDLANTFLLLANPNYDRTKFCTIISPLLYEMVQGCCKNLSLASCGITPAVFQQGIIPFIDEVGDYILQNPPVGRAANAADIKQALQTCCKPVDAGSNAVYGSILKNLAITVGGLKLLDSDTLTNAMCTLFLNNLMSRAMTSAIYPLWVSEQLLVSGIVNGLGNVLSTQSQIDNLLFGPSLQPVDVSSQLTLQFSQMSNLVYVLINMIIDQIPAHSDWFPAIFKHMSADSIKALLPSAGDLNAAFGKVYPTILGNRYINESLYLKVINVIVKGFQDSNTMLQNQ